MNNTNAKQKWKFDWGREYGILRIEAFCKSGLTLKPYIGITVPNWLAVCKSGNINLYQLETGWEAFRRALIKSGLGSWRDYIRLRTRWLRIFQRFRRLAYNLPTNFENLSNQELSRKFKQFTRLNTLSNGSQYIGFYLAEFATEKAEKWIRQRARELNLKNEDTLVYGLIQPIKPNTAVQIEMKMLELTADIKEKRLNNSETEQRLEDIYRAFFWLPCKDPIDSPWALSDIKNQLKIYLDKRPDPRAELLTLKKEWRLRPVNFWKTLAKLKPSIKEREFGRILAGAVYWKDRRDDYRRKTYAPYRPLFDEIGKRVGLNATTVQYFTEEEVLKALLNNLKLSDKESGRRKEHFVFLVRKGRTIIPDENEAAFLLEQIGAEEKKEREIKGIVGSPGVANGRAAVIWTKNELEKIRTGNVMIAKTTHPDYVPAMRQSVAIVTDEGGITCHAAIVSRELKIPCVVGTKIATKIFKDGDIVEVDANKGMVRKL